MIKHLKSNKRLLRSVSPQSGPTLDIKVLYSSTGDGVAAETQAGKDESDLELQKSSKRVRKSKEIKNRNLLNLCSVQQKLIFDFRRVKDTPQQIYSLQANMPLIERNMHTQIKNGNKTRLASAKHQLSRKTLA